MAALPGGPALAEVESRTFTLDQAVATAFDKNPKLEVLSEQVAEVEGRLRGARTLPFNPELEIQGASRSSAGNQAFDIEVGLAQEFQLAGHRGKRKEAASAELRAARAEHIRARRMLAAEVHLAFVDALEIRDLLEIARAETELARQLLTFARKRVEAGAGTLLDINVASAELGRAEQVVGVLAGEEVAARAWLAQVMGLSAAVLPTPIGDLAPREEPLPPLSGLLEAVEANRADLKALQELERASRARLALARAKGWPNLTVSGFVGREDGRDTLVGMGLALPLPLFQRNQGEVAEAQAIGRRVVAERALALLSVSRELVTAYERHRAGVGVLTSLRERILGSTEENLSLLGKAFTAGKADWTDILVMRRALFDVRRALTETRARVRRTRVQLDIAAGQMPLPSDGERERTQ